MFSKRKWLFWWKTCGLIIFGIIIISLWPNNGRFIQDSNNIVAQFKQSNELIPQDNHLYIPVINVNTKIVEGTSLKAIDKVEGVWHEPNTANPILPGNMVIAGHRFKWLPPNRTTFYNLDKVKVGDEIIIVWQQHVYRYQVYETTVVQPTAVEIRDNHGFNELTIYTCTPLWTTKQRLVVKAKPVDK
ncbi:MAG: class E sortase [Patescibacteria group bacterium]|jgi:LPXTG-site transpeptidase (sortase) family protein